MIDISYDEHKVPTITHEVNIFNVFEKNILGIIDDDLNHKNIFVTEFNGEIDVECIPFEFVSGDLGCKITLWKNKTIIEYTIKLSIEQARFLIQKHIMGVFDSIGHLLFGFKTPISKDFRTLFFIKNIQNELFSARTNNGKF